MSITFDGTTITMNDATTITTAPLVSLAADAIGSRVFAGPPSSVASGMFCDYGSTIAGSSLYPGCGIGTSSTQTWFRGTACTGTYRCIGYGYQTNGANYRVLTGYVRIA